MELRVMLQKLGGDSGAIGDLQGAIVSGYHSYRERKGGMPWTASRILNDYCTPSGFDELRDDEFPDVRDVFFAGVRNDSYSFFGVRINGEVRVWAGCRDFSLREARAHWYANDWSREAVERIEQWSLEGQKVVVGKVVPMPRRVDLGFHVHATIGEGASSDICLTVEEGDLNEYERIFLDQRTLQSLVNYARSHGWKVE